MIADAVVERVRGMLEEVKPKAPAAAAGGRGGGAVVLSDAQIKRVVLALVSDLDALDAPPAAARGKKAVQPLKTFADVLVERVSAALIGVVADQMAAYLAEVRSVITVREADVIKAVAAVLKEVETDQKVVKLKRQRDKAITLATQLMKKQMGADVDLSVLLGLSDADDEPQSKRSRGAASAGAAGGSAAAATAAQGSGDTQRVSGSPQ